MFSSLFSFGRRSNRDVTDALYAEIVASARQDVFYSQWNVPDTPLGRYEMLCLHMFLFLRAARGGDEIVRDVAQELTDEFFKDVDHSLRELGIGDVGVPKRMKKLARMFYGRVESYGNALDADDRPALAKALARNVRPGEDEWPQAAALAGYVMQADRALAPQAGAFASGKVEFPAADTPAPA